MLFASLYILHVQTCTHACIHMYTCMHTITHTAIVDRCWLERWSWPSTLTYIPPFISGRCSLRPEMIETAFPGPCFDLVELFIYL